MKKAISFFLFFYFYLISNSQITENVLPIKLENPNYSAESQPFLNSINDQVQIVAIGESTHGTKEFNTMYLETLKGLVLTKGFNTVFLEDEFSRCLEVNKYIRGESQNLNLNIGILRNWPWKTQEMLDLIEWMKSFNLENDNALQFIGIDIQDSEHIISSINRIFKKNNLDTVYYPNVNFGDQISNFEEVSSRYFENNLIDRLEEHISNIELSKESSEKVEYLVEHLKQSEKMMAEPLNHSYRDIAMGTNLLNHSKSQNLKGLFIAHNYHICKIYKPHKKDWKSDITAGGIIGDELKDRYFVILQDFDAGCFNAYSRNKSAEKMKRSKQVFSDYSMTENCIKESIPNSVGDKFRSIEFQTFYVNSSVCKKENFSKKKENKNALFLHGIGGGFYPAKNDPNQTSQFYYVPSSYFDGLIFHKNSSCTTLID